MLRKLLLMCLLATACDSPTVPLRIYGDVYDFRLHDSRQVLRWPVGTTVHVFTVTDADATHSQYLTDAVAFGASAWNSAAIYGEVQLEVVNSVQDADVVVQYTQAVSPVDASGCVPSGGLGTTTFCAAADGEHLSAFPLRDGSESHVKFLVTIRSIAVTSAEDARRLVAHELGHTLGISQHSPRPTDLMFGGALVRDTPNEGDRVTLQVLYHTDADITP